MPKAPSTRALVLGEESRHDFSKARRIFHVDHVADALELMELGGRNLACQTVGDGSKIREIKGTDDDEGGARYGRKTLPRWRLQLLQPQNRRSRGASPVVTRAEFFFV